MPNIYMNQKELKTLRGWLEYAIQSTQECECDHQDCQDGMQKDNINLNKILVKVEKQLKKD